MYWARPREEQNLKHYEMTSNLPDLEAKNSKVYRAIFFK